MKLALVPVVFVALALPAGAGPGPGEIHCPDAGTTSDGLTEFAPTAFTPGGGAALACSATSASEQPASAPDAPVSGSTETASSPTGAPPTQSGSVGPTGTSAPPASSGAGPGEIHCLDGTGSVAAVACPPATPAAVNPLPSSAAVTKPLGTEPKQRAKKAKKKAKRKRLTRRIRRAARR
jgi:hypothetical protein